MFLALRVLKYVFVRDVLDVVFSVCIVTRGAAFYMLVEGARGDHMEEAYSRDGLVTALYVSMSFGSKVRPIPCGCVAMGSAVLFILRSRLLLIVCRVWSEQSASCFVWI